MGILGILLANKLSTKSSILNRQDTDFPKLDKGFSHVIIPNTHQHVIFGAVGPARKVVDDKVGGIHGRGGAHTYLKDPVNLDHHYTFFWEKCIFKKLNRGNRYTFYRVWHS